MSLILKNEGRDEIKNEGKTLIVQDEGENIRTKDIVQTLRKRLLWIVRVDIVLEEIKRT